MDLTMQSLRKSDLLAAEEPIEGMSVIVTPHTASIWRKRWHYEGQRTFKQWHCNNLVKMMKEGKFRKNTQIAFVYFDGCYYLTNGQHTLAAVELSGVPQELSIAINSVDSAEEVADDFSRHDTHLTRQFGDALAAHNVHEEFGISKRALHFVTAAVIYYAWLFGETGQKSAQQITHDQKLILVRKYGALASKVIGFWDGAGAPGHLTRRTTMASAMFCAQKQPDNAHEFFRAIALDDGLRIGDPRKTLLEWLKSRQTNRTTASGDAKIAADHEFVKAIAAAWNAWIDGRELKAIRINYDGSTAEFKNVGVITVRPAKAAKT